MVSAMHEAWCWYKLKVLIEMTGHRVTALGLSASGTNLKTLGEVRTLYDYTLPLIELRASLPPNEKVILVGHSLGGMNLALTMDKYPEKISVAVFLNAFLPDTIHKPSYVLDKIEIMKGLSLSIMFVNLLAVISTNLPEV
ncbi:hypothetical protein F0562_003893 [Nyssa sinensis]|uniref:AB hydrolase-1 domain-containing protein n=1 Tax=Nyssa sinensis TaxID=561372 RepID=A0A5J5BVV7_9ASTE|nr:hypothetical protein F0562_003893 [Nyssa sinensis]